MNVRTFAVGDFGTNLYLVSGGSGKTVVVDPGMGSDRVLKILDEENSDVRMILNTHAHFDHTFCNGIFKEQTGADLAIHERDLELLRRQPEQGGMYGIQVPPSPEPDVLLRDGETVEIEDLPLKVIHCPGHSPGGICLYGGGVLFSGDTLFAGSIGRTDLPGGNTEELLGSIKNRLLGLPDDTKVYPGHGPVTDIKTEKRTNPFLGKAFSI